MFSLFGTGRSQYKIGRFYRKHVHKSSRFEKNQTQQFRVNTKHRPTWIHVCLAKKKMLVMHTQTTIFVSILTARKCSLVISKIPPRNFL